MNFSRVQFSGDRNATETAGGGRFDRIVLDQTERSRRWAEYFSTLGDELPIYTYANHHYAGFGSRIVAQLERLVKGVTGDGRRRSSSAQHLLRPLPAPLPPGCRRPHLPRSPHSPNHRALGQDLPQVIRVERLSAEASARLLVLASCCARLPLKIGAVTERSARPSLMV